MLIEIETVVVLTLQSKVSNEFFYKRKYSSVHLFLSIVGTIVSPNYPAFYDSTDDCLYRIESRELKQIEITIQDFKMPTMKNCTDGGELIIYDGSTFKSKVLRRECGNNLSSDAKLNTVVSSSNEVLIRFVLIIGIESKLNIM